MLAEGCWSCAVNSTRMTAAVLEWLKNLLTDELTLAVAAVASQTLWRCEVPREWP